MSDTSISEGDARHLECVEREPFHPIGWLYSSVFADLYSRRLVTITGSGCGYIISAYGAEQLKKFREGK